MMVTLELERQNYTRIRENIQRTKIFVEKYHQTFFANVEIYHRTNFVNFPID